MRKHIYFYQITDPKEHRTAYHVSTSRTIQGTPKSLVFESAKDFDAIEGELAENLLRYYQAAHKAADMMWKEGGDCKPIAVTIKHAAPKPDPDLEYFRQKLQGLAASLTELGNAVQDMRVKVDMKSKQ